MSLQNEKQLLETTNIFDSAKPWFVFASAGYFLILILYCFYILLQKSGGGGGSPRWNIGDKPGIGPIDQAQALPNIHI